MWGQPCGGSSPLVRTISSLLEGWGIGLRSFGWLDSRLPLDAARASGAPGSRVLKLSGGGARLDPLFLDVVDVEPDADDFAGGDELGDVSFEELLEFDGHFGDAFVAHVVVPLDDLARFAGSGVFVDPGADGFVVCSGGDEGFEVVGGDADEAEEEVIERAVEVVFAVGAREDGAAFVEGACCDDVAVEDGAWTAGVGAIGEIGGEGGDVGYGC